MVERPNHENYTTTISHREVPQGGFVKETVNHFERFMSLGYRHIVPIIPPGAVLSERSTLHKRLHNPKKPRDERGKVPGFSGRDGRWFSYAWQKDHDPQPEFWHSIGAGVGIKPGPVFDGDEQLDGHVIAIDADTYLPEHAAIVERILDARIGAGIPKRVGRAPKALYLVRTDADFKMQPIVFGDQDENGQRPNRVEFLTKDRQFIAQGIHPKTMQPYVWERPIVSAKALPFVPGDVMRAIAGEIMAALPQAGLIEADRLGSAEPVAPEHRRADVKLVRAALQTLPNTIDTHPTRDHYVKVMYATRGALPDDEHEAFDTFEEWALGWGDNTPDNVRDDWDRMQSEPYSGFPALMTELRRVGKDAAATELLGRHFFDTAAGDAAILADAKKLMAEKQAPLSGENLPNSFEQEDRPLIEAAPWRGLDPSGLPRRQWLYGTHYIRRYVSTTAAPTAVGKSSMTMVEGLAMITGKPLLGVQPKGEFRVWIWNGEDPLEELELRIAAAMRHYGITKEDLQGRLFLNSGRDMPIKMARADKHGAKIAIPVVNEVIETIRRNKIDVMVLDPFVSTYDGPETNELFDPIVKKWGFIAGATNTSIELVHHTRKLNNAEVSIDDARGGGALAAGARAKRILARMAKADGKKFGIREEDQRRFFRVADASVNMALPAINSTVWFEMRGVSVGNGEGDGTLADLTGDQVGVATLRTMQADADGLDATTIDRIKAALRVGEWRENFRSNAWAGYAIADVLRLDPKEDRASVEAALREMKASGALKVERRADKNNNIVPFIVVVEADNLSIEMDKTSENPFE